MRRENRRLLTAADLEGRGEVKVLIRRVRAARFGGEPVTVVDLNDRWSLALNQTNRRRLLQVLGEARTWPGKQFRLHLEDTKFKGQPVPGVRVFMPALTPTRKETA